jgi:hypothetical protein
MKLNESAKKTFERDQEMGFILSILGYVELVL